MATVLSFSTVPAFAQFEYEGRVLRASASSEAVTFPYIPIDHQYGAQAHMAFESQLNMLRFNPVFTAKLKDRERELLNLVNIEIRDDQGPVFQVEFHNPKKPVMVFSWGSAFYAMAFGHVLGAYEILNDDMLIGYFLQSEQRAALTGQRWFELYKFIQLRGNTPPLGTDPKFIMSQQGSTNLILLATTLHELCHLFLSHEPQSVEDRRNVILQRNRELAADRCAGDHMMRIGANPEAAMTFATAFDFAQKDAESASHPPSPERLAQMRGFGDRLLAAAIASGAGNADEIRNYRPKLARIQTVIHDVYKYANRDIVEQRTTEKDETPDQAFDEPVEAYPPPAAAATGTSPN